MLVSFTIENYLSFCERQTIDFESEPLKEHKDYLHIPYLYDINYRLLKSIAIYGHNSHGKTNFIKSYQFFRNLIFKSFTFGKTEGFIDVDFFKLNTYNKNKPTYFQIVFLIREIKYRYSFEILNGKIISESLWYAQPKIRENYLFERVGEDIKLSKTWAKESEKITQSVLFTKSHNLFLSVLISQDNIPRTEEINNWFKGNIILTNTETDKDLNRAVLILAQEQYRSMVQKFIEHADVGFKTIIEKIDSYTNNKLKLEKNFLNVIFSHELETFELYSQHAIYDEKKNWVEHILFEVLKSESSGSIKYLILACYLTFAIKQNQLILIDEIDSSLHVFLLLELIKIFNSKRINAVGSQMIFSIHNTALLDNKIIRRDQIHFITKNQFGESSLQKLHTGKNPIRKDIHLEKNYLKGDFGGVSEKLKNTDNTLF